MNNYFELVDTEPFYYKLYSSRIGDITYTLVIVKGKYHWAGIRSREDAVVLKRFEEKGNFKLVSELEPIKKLVFYFLLHKELKLETEDLKAEFTSNEWELLQCSNSSFEPVLKDSCLNEFQKKLIYGITSSIYKNDKCELICVDEEEFFIILNDTSLKKIKFDEFEIVNNKLFHII